jgi:hypothetical protein
MQKAWKININHREKGILRQLPSGQTFLVREGVVYHHALCTTSPDLRASRLLLLPACSPTLHCSRTLPLQLACTLVPRAPTIPAFGNYWRLRNFQRQFTSLGIEIQLIEIDFEGGRSSRVPACPCLPYIAAPRRIPSALLAPALIPW